MAVPFVMPEDDVADVQNLIRIILMILSRTRVVPTDENMELVDNIETLIRLLLDNMKRRTITLECDNHLRNILNGLIRDKSVLSGLRCRNNDDYSSIVKSPSSVCCCCCSCSCEKSAGKAVLVVDEQEELNRQEQTRTRTSRRPSFWRSMIERSSRWTWWRAMPIICAIGLHLFQRTYM